MSRRRLPARYQVEIDVLADDGTGLAAAAAVEERSDGVTRSVELSREVRVKGALPGERVTARVLKKRRGVVHTEVLSGSDDHPDRVRPPCPHFPRCGGCSLQHMNYAAQVMHKSAVVLDILARAGVDAACVASPVTAARAHYRRKARLGVRAIGDRVFAGFRETMSSRVVDVPFCATLDPRIGGPLDDLRRTLERMACRAAIPQIEVAAGEGRTAFCVRHLTPLQPDDRAALLAFGTRNGLEILVQPAGYDSVVRLLDEQPPAPLDYSLPARGLNFLFPATGFVQINAAINERIVDHVVATLAPGPGEAVADLFCGVGNLSLPLARAGALVTGLESDRQAISWARRNAERNNLLRRTRFEVVDLYRDGPAPTSDKWVLDPPRSGAGPQLERWLTANPARIVYVSCNPATFASDGAALQRNGLVLSKLTMFDMFPHTGHIELVGVWDRG